MSIFIYKGTEIDIDYNTFLKVPNIGSGAVSEEGVIQSDSTLTVEELLIVINSLQLSDEQLEINSTSIAYLAATDWKLSRHNDEILSGVVPTLNPTQLAQLLTSRQAARDSITNLNKET